MGGLNLSWEHGHCHLVCSATDPAERMIAQETPPFLPGDTEKKEEEEEEEGAASPVLQCLQQKPASMQHGGGRVHAAAGRIRAPDNEWSP